MANGIKKVLRNVNPITVIGALTLMGSGVFILWLMKAPAFAEGLIKVKHGALNYIEGWIIVGIGAIILGLELFRQSITNYIGILAAGAAIFLMIRLSMNAEVVKILPGFWISLGGLALTILGNVITLSKRG